MSKAAQLITAKAAAQTPLAVRFLDEQSTAGQLVDVVDGWATIGQGFQGEAGYREDEYPVELVSVIGPM